MDHEAHLNHAYQGALKFRKKRNWRVLSVHINSRHFFIFLYFSALPVLFKFKIPIRQREIDVCSAEFTVEELLWCTEPTQNCQGRQTARLLADASWDITTRVTANGPHPLCVCVIRPLTSIWPDLSFSLILQPHFFVTLIQYALLPTHSGSCRTHTHRHMQMLKTLR